MNTSRDFLAGKITAGLKESISRRTGKLNKLLIKAENYGNSKTTYNLTAHKAI